MTNVNDTVTPRFGSLCEYMGHDCAKDSFGLRKASVAAVSG